MLGAVLETVPTDQLVIADDLILRDVGPGDVKLKVAHSGVCHSDLSAMNGTIPTEPGSVLGHEGAGIVLEVGEGVTHVSEGDHVIIAFGGAAPLHVGRIAEKLNISKFCNIELAISIFHDEALKSRNMSNTFK